MSETDFRNALVQEALTWVGTPYRAAGKIKGVGVNCAMFLYQVGKAMGILANAPEPRWYTPQFASNSKEERLVNYIQAYGGLEIEFTALRPSDLIAYRTGLSYGHLAMVVDMPNVVHCTPPFGCEQGIYNEGKMGMFGRRYFTFWHP